MEVTVTMEEIGIVKEVIGDEALVSVARKSVCDQCTAGTCKLGSAEAEIRAFNQAGAKTGQTVRVVLRHASYLKGSLIAFGIPALALAIGAVLGKELADRGIITGIDAEASSAIFAFSMLGLSFVIVKLYSMSADKNKNLKPVVEEIIEEDKKP